MQSRKVESSYYLNTSFQALSIFGIHDFELYFFKEIVFTETFEETKSTPYRKKKKIAVLRHR